MSQSLLIIYNCKGVKLFTQTINLQGKLISFKIVYNNIYILTDQGLFSIEDINKYIWSTRTLKINFLVQSDAQIEYQIFEVKALSLTSAQLLDSQYQQQKIIFCWKNNENKFTLYGDLNELGGEIVNGKILYKFSLPNKFQEIQQIKFHPKQWEIIEVFSQGYLTVFNIKMQRVELELNYNLEQSYVFTPFIGDLPLVYNNFYKQLIFTFPREIELLKDIDLICFREKNESAEIYTLQGIYEIQEYHNQFSSQALEIEQIYQLYQQQKYGESILNIKQRQTLFDDLKQILVEIDQNSDINRVKEMLKAFNFAKLFLSGQYQYQLCQQYDKIIDQLELIKLYHDNGILAGWLDRYQISQKQLEILLLNSQDLKYSDKLSKNTQIHILQLQFLQLSDQEYNQIINQTSKIFQELTKIEKIQLSRWLININYNQQVIKYIIKQSDDQDLQIDLLMKLEAYSDAIELCGESMLYDEIISIFVFIQYNCQEKAVDIFNSLTEQLKQQIIQYIIANFKNIIQICELFIKQIADQSLLLQYKLQQVKGDKVLINNNQLLQYEHQTSDYVDILKTLIQSNRHLSKVIQIDKLQGNNLKQIFILFGNLIYEQTFNIIFPSKQIKLQNIDLKQVNTLDEAVKLLQSLDKKMNINQQQSIQDLIVGILQKVQERADQEQDFQIKSAIINTYIGIIADLLNQNIKQLKSVIGNIILIIYQIIPHQYIIQSNIQPFVQYISGYQLLQLSQITENKIFIEKGLQDLQFRLLMGKCYKSLSPQIQQYIK